MRYGLVNAVFLGLILIAYVMWRPKIAWKRLAITFAFLAILTLIFDNVIIGMHIVMYHPENILGFKLGLVPLEDFAYTLAAVLLIPLLWSFKNNAE